MNEKAIKALQVLAKIADAYDANNLDDEARKYWGEDNQFQNHVEPKRVQLYAGRGGKQLLTLQDCLDARDALNELAADNSYCLKGSAAVNANPPPDILPVSVMAGGVFSKGIETRVLINHLKRVSTYPEGLRDQMSERTELAYSNSLLSEFKNSLSDLLSNDEASNQSKSS